MSTSNNDIPSLLMPSGQHFRVSEDHTLPQLIFGYRKSLQAFNYQITKMMIEFVHNDLEIGVAPFRE
jgi:hypothetical protein